MDMAAHLWWACPQTVLDTNAKLSLINAIYKPNAGYYLGKLKDARGLSNDTLVGHYLYGGRYLADAFPFQIMLSAAESSGQAPPTRGYLRGAMQILLDESPVFQELNAIAREVAEQCASLDHPIVPPVHISCVQERGSKGITAICVPTLEQREERPPRGDIILAPNANYPGQLKGIYSYFRNSRPIKT